MKCNNCGAEMAKAKKGMPLMYEDGSATSFDSRGIHWKWSERFRAPVYCGKVSDEEEV